MFCNKKPKPKHEPFFLAPPFPFFIAAKKARNQNKKERKKD
jgi:hypothetical protein